MVTEKDIRRVTGKQDAVVNFHALQLVMPGNQQRVPEDKLYTNPIVVCGNEHSYMFPLFSW